MKLLYQHHLHDHLTVILTFIEDDVHKSFVSSLELIHKTMLSKSKCKNIRNFPYLGWPPTPNTWKICILYFTSLKSKWFLGTSMTILFLDVIASLGIYLNEFERLRIFRVDIETGNLAKNWSQKPNRRPLRPTEYQQRTNGTNRTNRRPTEDQQMSNRGPKVYQQMSNRWPTDDQQRTNRQHTDDQQKTEYLNQKPKT